MSRSLDDKRKVAVVHFWDVGTGKAARRPFECDALRVVENPISWLWTIREIAFDSDLKTLTTTEIGSNMDGKVRKWDLTTGKLIGELHPGVASEGISREVVSPDGKRKLKTFQWDSTASITGPSTSESGQIQHQGAVMAGAFSPDGTRFLTGSWDKTARLWDSATLKPIGPSIKHGLPVLFVSFSPDGKEFWTGSESDARVQRMRPSAEGSAERIVLWIQVLTGAELRGVQHHVLDGDEW